MTWRRRGVALWAAAALLVMSACGSGGGEQSGGGGGQQSGETVTIDWWHIGTQEPFRTVRTQQAEAFMKANPNVKINVQAIENDAFKTKMTTVAQSGDLPDIYHTWGGGVLKQQIDAGLVKDISGDIASWKDTIAPSAWAAYTVDGKVYGVPFDNGMVGFWYNKKMFKEAGIEEPPTTWSGLLDAVKKLKESGVTPIALAGGEKWPGHFYWSYLAMRVGGVEALAKAGEDHNFNTPDFIQAGKHLQELVALEPFQKGFLGAKYNTPDGQAALVGSGKAAMELMGQWAPNVQKEASGKGLGDDLGWFPFPAVEGGKGNGADAFGGGNGYAVSADAPPAAVEFLKFISSVEEQKKLAAEGAIQPVVKGAEEALKDDNLKTVGQTLNAATGFQLYLDQAYPPAVGQQVNDSVAELIAGKKTPEQIVQEISETAKTAE